MNKVGSEDSPVYLPTAAAGRPERVDSVSLMLEASKDAVIERAISIIEERLHRVDDTVYSSPDLVKRYCFLKLAQEPVEFFGVLFLDNRHRLIEYQSLFRGTIHGASVHPREVARAAIEANAVAVVLTHNHPSGVPEPSRADTTLTKRLVEALNLLDICVLDHIVVGSTLEGCVSFAERGLI